MIDDQLSEFVQGGVGIHIGTRDAELEPNGARAVAVQVDKNGTQLVVYLATVAATRVLPDLEANGYVAVVFARPTDDRSCQIKGTFVNVRAVRSAERPIAMAQWARFMENLERIGIPRAAAQHWVTWPLVAVRLRVTSVFEQTPGPGAGAQLR